MALLDFAQPVIRREWTRRLLAPLDESAWERLARELFAWQFARVPAYRRLCEAHGVTPRKLRSWRDIPAAPQQLFKLEKLFVHGSRRPQAIYETSGTTTGQPGRQHLLRTDVYRAVSLAGARRIGFLESNLRLHFLIPPAATAPHSSLSAMFSFWAKNRPAHFWAQKNGFNFTGLHRTLTKEKRPIALCGTAFSFVHLLEAGLPSLRLPHGSRILETGGFKGRSREVPKAELYREVRKFFGVKDNAIWNEYGMSELSSQAYAQGKNGPHFAPPWARVLVWDIAKNREARLDEQGLVRWIDLANVDSVMALQTLDLAERTRNGFRLIGRMPRTEPRGCSLGADDLAS